MERERERRQPAGCASVFNYDRVRWTTDGRAIFNLNPTEAVQFYQANLERFGPRSGLSR